MSTPKLISKEEAIKEMKNGKSVRHTTLFLDYEYIRMSPGKNFITTEDNASVPEKEFWALRTSDVWNSNWEVL